MRRTLCFVAFLVIALVASSLVASHAFAQAQRDNLGTEFYVAFGPNEGGEGGMPTRNLMALYITSKVPAHGKVEVPAIGFYRSFSTTPGQITTINLPSGNVDGSGNADATVELSVPERPTPGMAVHITSDSEVAVFGMNHKLYSSDAFMALPVDVLGTEYRTINYTASNYAGDIIPDEFWMVGVEDSTNVTVTLNDNSLNYSKGQPVTFRLNRGDTYLVQGASTPTNDLTGSHVESDHPIAVFSGHMRTQIPYNALARNHQPSRDHLVEQLPPVSAWGDSALVVPYATSAAPDLVRVVAAEDETDVTVNGTSIGKTLNAGDYYEITKLGGVTSIQASKPILTGQYLHTSVGALDDPQYPAYGDPALALVFPVEQFTTAYTILSIVDSDSFTGNFVNIVADGSAIGSMQIDGSPIAASEFKPIAGSRFMYAQHRLQQGTHNLTGAKPFGVTVYGLGPVDSYAYTGGTLLKTITPLKTIGLKIDFGDRVLDASLNGKFDTTVFLQNISEDTVNIYSFPRRIQDTSKFHVIAPATPLVLAPGDTTSMVIEFEPRELYRRMHTQVTAKTDHLRAYVVDVYGRGVSDELGLFRESAKVNTLDVIDFGIFESTDAPVDSVIYVGNAGLAPLQVTGSTLSGTNASDFSLGVPSYQGATVTIPYTIPQSPSSALKIPVRFTPSGASGSRTAQVTVTSLSGSTHTVLLKARIETIVPASTPTASSFNTTSVCNSGSQDLTVTNSNDLDVTLTEATVVGTNAGDFVVATPTPLVIPAQQSRTIKVLFQPIDRGTRTAQVRLQFDLPKNQPPVYCNVSGNATKRSLLFTSTKGVTAHGTEEFYLPVYAKTDLTPYGCSGYIMHVNYDSVYLELVDATITGTLFPKGYLSVLRSRGHDTVLFSPQKDNDILSGGGPNAATPLIYLRFRARLNGEDPQTFTKRYAVNYDVSLTGAKIGYTCADHVFNGGAAEVLSVCSTPHLTPKSGLPTQMALEPTSPNPFNPSTTFEYAVSEETQVRVQVIDELGHVVRMLIDDTHKPGYYTATFDGAGLASGAYTIEMIAGNYHGIRRVILSK